MTKRVLAGWVVVATLLLAWPAAAEMPVPPNIQAAVFLKIFALDKSLVGGGPLKVLVVGTDDSAQAVTKAFRSVGLAAESVTAGDLGGALQGARVVYVISGSDATKTADLASGKGFLTIAGEPTLAEKGTVAIAIGAEADKPKIIVHEGRLKASGKTLLDDLRKVAKVVG